VERAWGPRRCFRSGPGLGVRDLGPATALTEQELSVIRCLPRAARWLWAAYILQGRGGGDASVGGGKTSPSRGTEIALAQKIDAGKKTSPPRGRRSAQSGCHPFSGGATPRLKTGLPRCGWAAQGDLWRNLGRLSRPAPAQVQSVHGVGAEGPLVADSAPEYLTRHRPGQSTTESSVGQPRG